MKPAPPDRRYRQRRGPRRRSLLPWIRFQSQVCWLLRALRMHRSKHLIDRARIIVCSRLGNCRVIIRSLVTGLSPGSRHGGYFRPHFSLDTATIIHRWHRRRFGEHGVIVLADVGFHCCYLLGFLRFVTGRSHNLVWTSVASASIQPCDSVSPASDSIICVVAPRSAGRPSALFSSSSVM